MLNKDFFIVLSLAVLGLTACGGNNIAEDVVVKKETHDERRIGTENEHAEEVRIPVERIAELGITVEPLRGGSVNSSIERPATVLFDPDRTVKIGPRISGKVERVMADLGMKVQRGDTLAVLSSVELGKVRANYLTQLARFETRQAAYRRENLLYEEKISSAAEYLEAKARFEEAEADLHAAQETLELYGVASAEVERVKRQATLPLSHFYLKSPIRGVVQERNLAPGETLSPEDTPIHIVDPRVMWVMIDAYEQDMTRVRPGQKVELTVSSLPGKRFTGKVNWISHSLDTETRTLKVRAVVENPDLLLRHGMYGTAHILNDSEKGRPIVPVSAVQTVGDEQVVFVPGDEPGSFRPVRVVPGAENNGWVEIASELQPGNQVVTDGAFHLKAALTAHTRSAAHGH